MKTADLFTKFPSVTRELIEYIAEHGQVNNFEGSPAKLAALSAMCASASARSMHRCEGDIMDVAFWQLRPKDDVNSDDDRRGLDFVLSLVCTDGKVYSTTSEFAYRDFAAAMQFQPSEGRLDPTYECVIVMTESNKGNSILGISPTMEI